MKSQPPVTEEQESKTDPSEFALAVTRIATAQICQSVGFTSAQRFALNTLTDVAARYLRALAESAAVSAASSGRTQSNLYDVVRALEDLGSVHGFRGAWSVTRTILASPTLVDLAKFVEYIEETPFAKPIPRRPRTEKCVSPANSTGFSHIPRWLPAFPEMVRTDVNVEETLEEGRSGFGIGIESCGKVDGGCLVGEKMRVGLLEKRERVRFQMGWGVGRGRGKGGVEVGAVDLRNGVCRGGKRVSCQVFCRNVDDKDRGDDDKKKKKESNVPRKRTSIVSSSK